MKDCLLYSLVLGLFSSCAAQASIIIHSPDYELVDTWDLASPGSVTFNPFDGFAYGGNRSNGNIYRLNSGGTTDYIGWAGNVAGLASDPLTGDLYASNDYGGYIFRFDASNSYARATTMGGAISGDDDTAGVTVVPLTYTGGLVSPGTGLFTDRNNAGDDFLFSFLNPTDPTDPHTITQLIRSNSQPSSNPAGFSTPNGGASAWVDLAVTNTSIFMLDDGQETSSGGQMYRLDPGLELTPLLPMTSDITRPSGIGAPLTGDFLYLSDDLYQALYRYNLVTGETLLIADGLNNVFWGSVATNHDGSEVWVADQDKIYQLAVIQKPVDLLHGLMGGGGGVQTTAIHSLDSSTGGPISGGIQTFAETEVKAGFTGQLYDPRDLQVDAYPSTVEEDGTRQVSATYLLDDDTLLAIESEDVDWSLDSGPIASLSATGLATAGTVYQNETAVVRGERAGFSGTVALTVENTNQDDYLSYGGDTVDDAWQVTHFGLPPNANAAPGFDADSDGFDNYGEWITGFVPTDPADFLRFRITELDADAETVTFQINRVLTGRSYEVVRFELDGPPLFEPVGTLQPLEAASDATLQINFQADPAAFYRLNITMP